jgi:hypothetical protein
MELKMPRTDGGNKLQRSQNHEKHSRQNVYQRERLVLREAGIECLCRWGVCCE